MSACTPSGLVSAEVPAAAAGESVELALAPGGRIGGRLTEDEGKPIANAGVSVRSPGRKAVLRRCRTAPDGTFTTGYLAPGSYEVELRARQGSRSPIVLVTAGATTGVEVSLSR